MLSPQVMKREFAGEEKEKEGVGERRRTGEGNSERKSTADSSIPHSLSVGHDCDGKPRQNLLPD